MRFNLQNYRWIFLKKFIWTKNSYCKFGISLITLYDTTKRLMSYPKCRSVEVINKETDDNWKGVEKSFEMWYWYKD
jgi:hypothetical protein